MTGEQRDPQMISTRVNIKSISESSGYVSFIPFACPPIATNADDSVASRNGTGFWSDLIE